MVSSCENYHGALDLEGNIAAQNIGYSDDHFYHCDAKPSSFRPVIQVDHFRNALKREADQKDIFGLSRSFHEKKAPVLNHSSLYEKT
jgi:hypothetical protein